jgi:hypothetical protein
MQKPQKNPPHSHVPLMTDHCSFPLYSSRFTAKDRVLNYHNLAQCVYQMKEAWRRGMFVVKIFRVYCTRTRKCVSGDCEHRGVYK